MELKLTNLNAYECPSHSMIGENVFWGSGYWIDKEECFRKGANILVGSITIGGWSLTYSLAFPNKYLDTSTQVVINGKKCSLRKLEKLSFYVGDCTSQIFLQKTAEQLIWKQAKRWSRKKVFKLLDELGINESAESFCEAPMCGAGKDIWKYSIVLGILMKKSIFLFPWISSPMLEEIQEDIVRIGKVLKEKEMILLMPVEDDNFLQGTALEYERCRLTRVCGERMQRERVNAVLDDIDTN